MIKTTYICDNCKQEMPEPNPMIFGFKNPDHLLELHVGHLNDPSTPPHICQYCIVDLVVKVLDDREKVVAAGYDNLSEQIKNAVIEKPFRIRRDIR